MRKLKLFQAELSCFVSYMSGPESDKDLAMAWCSKMMWKAEELDFYYRSVERGTD